MPNAIARKKWAAAPAAFCALALAAFAASLLLHPRMPALGDFGDWTYEAVLLRDLLRGIHHAGYILKPYPVPNSWNTIVIALLSFVCGWQLAAKLYLCIQLAINFFCARSLARAANTHPALWFVLPGIFCGLNFWYGFTNFQTGVAWAMLICAMLLRRDLAAWKYAALLCLCFFTHMIPTAFAGLAVLLWWLQQKDRTARWILTALAPVTLLTCWYAAGRFLGSHNADVTVHIEASVRYGTPAFIAYKINSLLKSFGFVNPSTNDDHSVALKLLGDKLFRVLFIANAVLALAFVVLIVRRVRVAFREHLEERFLWWTAAVFAVIYFVAPGIALGVSDPGSRALQVALWVVMFLAADRFETSRVFVTAAAIFAIALLAANLTLFVRLVSSPVVDGATGTTLHAAVAKFSHVFYEDKTQYYQAIDRGDYSLEIFPTGMFLKR